MSGTAMHPAPRHSNGTATAQQRHSNGTATAQQRHSDRADAPAFCALRGSTGNRVRGDGRCSVQCANCGRTGHVYKVCKHPVNSFGVICFRVRNRSLENLMVQRNFSLCFVESVRGNYMLQNRTYILRLVSNMTDEERGMLLQGPFAQIWNVFWHTEDEDAIASCFVREFNKSSYLYMQLRKGYWLRSGDPPETKLRFFSLASAMIDTHAVYSEPEWGFPKGRRNINESDFECAKREFTEETVMDPEGILFLHNVKPVEETFFDMNRVNYRHTYYVASVHLPQIEAAADAAHSREEDSLASRTWWDGREHEIRRLEWFNEKDVRRRIRHENSTRLHMFDMLHHRISRVLMTPPRPDDAGGSSSIRHV
eukprot:gene10932-17046_t